MAFPGPDKGAAPRTLRRVALEKGAAGPGLVPDMPYNAQGGHPTGPGMPTGEYNDKALAAFPTGSKSSQGIKPF